MRWYIGNLALADLKRAIFTNQQLASAGKKNKHFLIIAGTVLAAGATGGQIYSAAAHSAGLRFAIQELLIFGVSIQIYDENFCTRCHTISSKKFHYQMSLFKKFLSFCQLLS
jgi:hypothetical protein